MMKKLKRTPSPTQPTKYPVGSFVETEKGYFFISANNKRLRILTKRILDSWSPPRVIKTTEAAVQKYTITAKMAFRNGSLIWNISDGKVYLIENSERRWLRSPDVYTRLGATPKDVVCVSEREIELHRQGADLT